MAIDIKTASLGYPRIGRDRELKKAIEAFWKGELSQGGLETSGREIRKSNWLTQKEAGIEIIPSNDFSFYDQVLDMSALLGAVPKRYGFKGDKVNLSTYFHMARGIQEKEGIGSKAVPAMEMTKWFDTNYHYIVPEFSKDREFRLASDKPFNEFKEALSLGIKTRPVLIGPATYLLLGKAKEKGFTPLDFLSNLLPVYVEILKKLRVLGAESVQMDEPILVTDLGERARLAVTEAYITLAQKVEGFPLHVATYFGALKDNLKVVAELPVDGIHIDLVRAPEQLKEVVNALPQGLTLSLGVVDGRNIWKCNMRKTLDLIKSAVQKRPAGKFILAPSCSLLHTPFDLDAETNLDADLKNWLAFAKQKLSELAVMKKAIQSGESTVKKELEANQKAIENRKQSKRIHVSKVEDRLAGLKSGDYKRKSRFKTRQEIQRKRLKLPLFPTTTIGSFPQTGDVRKARAQFKKGELSESRYNDFLRRKTEDVIRRQTEIGLDVLVHGEFERNDMVEYFGEQLEGFAFTENGWVQSYGTRGVKPPVIFGDVWRPKPMTVEWTKLAQSLTEKPVKGMLTGPITILQWSFVRDDQPRSETCRQIALAIRDEVGDLEKAGTAIIQIDEPAIREGLPLRKKDWKAYLQWAVECFRLTSSGVKDETQIHTHMCYSEFNDIIESIAEMDADVISIETSRSQMELLDVFTKFKYPNEIGPGVYDIHSPRVPPQEEIENLLKKASSLLPPNRIWVNPDCGLKTRGWEETVLSLKSMVNAAKTLRKQFSSNQKTTPVRI